MSAITASSLPVPVESYLRRYAQRRAVQRLIRRGGLAVLVTIAWALLWCVVDRLIALPPAMRVMLLAINAVVVVILIGRPLVRMLLPVDRSRVAREIERREPDWREKLATFVSRTLG